MIKVKFWVDDIESEIFEYDYDDENDEDFIEEMEQNRAEWIIEQIDTGYIIIKD